MHHPTEGVLRRLLDEPAGVAEADRRHVADCSGCLHALAAVRADAARVSTALAPGPGVDAEPDVAAGWQRLSAGLRSEQAPVRAAAPARTGRVRALLRRPATAALAVTVALAGAGTAAANDWLPAFRTERVAPVAFSTGDLLALPDLSAFGELTVEGDEDVRSVSGADDAARRTGLDVPEVTALPQGVTGEPVHQVVGQVTATFVFSAERAARAAAEAGEPLPAVPPGLDGSALRLDAGPGVAQVWTSSSGAPALVVGRTAAPTGSTSGVPFEVARDYLLSLPGLPDQVADQLRAFAADGTTLPLPVPRDLATSTPAEVDGVPATVLATRDRSLAAVVWVRDGAVTVVAGALSGDEVLEVARGLR